MSIPFASKELIRNFRQKRHRDLINNLFVSELWDTSELVAG